MLYLVPGHRTPAQIYIGAAREIYLFCNHHGYIDTWVYLFNEWYNPRAWKTWTRCTAGDRIPMAKTTMLIEAHWKVLKRNHLYHYNRARLDLLVYVIMDRYFPDLRYKFNRDTVIGSHATRWANEFTKEWNRLVGREENSNANALYEPSTETWTCGCPSFLTSRYLVCKHLVRRSQHGRFGPNHFFIHRRITAPFIQILDVRCIFFSVLSTIHLSVNLTCVNDIKIISYIEKRELF